MAYPSQNDNKIEVKSWQQLKNVLLADSQPRFSRQSLWNTNDKNGIQSCFESL